MAELQGRVAVVTGGGSGIGRAIALTLAREGAKVAVLDINLEGAKETASLIHAASGQARGFSCDVTSEESVHTADAGIRSAFGPADIVINNAGLLRAKPLAELTLADWNATLAVDLTGYFICASVFGREMRARGRGSFVHIGSIASRFAQTRGGAYSAAKAGVIGLSATIAAEWGPEGVRSNVLHPGMIRTALSEAFYQDPELKRRREATVASRRTGMPDDIAEVASFLASDRSGYINGAELTVDGGFSRMAIDLIPRPGFDRG